MKKLLLLLQLFTGMIFSQQFPVSAYYIYSAASGVPSHTTQLQKTFPLMQSGYFNYGYPFSATLSDAQNNELLDSAAIHNINIILGTPLQSYAAVERFYLDANDNYFSYMQGSLSDPPYDQNAEQPTNFYDHTALKATVANDYMVKNVKYQPNNITRSNLNYHAYFRLKISRTGTTDPNTPVVDIEIWDATKVESTIKRTLKSSDFPLDNTYYLFECNFNSLDTCTPSSPSSFSTLSVLQNDDLQLDQIANSLWCHPHYFDFNVKWYGQIQTWLDNIRIDGTFNTTYDPSTLFNGGYDNQINTIAKKFNTKPALARFYLRDEPYINQYLAYDHINKQLIIAGQENGIDPASGKGLGYTAMTTEDPNYGSFDRYAQEAVPYELATDIYRFHWGAPLQLDPNYTSFAQNEFQTAIAKFKLAQQNSVYTNSKTWQYFPNISQFSNITREPYLSEIYAQVNLALAYGAKGVHYFGYWTESNRDMIGLVDPNLDPINSSSPYSVYHENKWDGIKSLNLKLALVGPTLMNLAWQGGYSIHTNPGYPNYITNISAYTTGGTQDSYPSSTYVELGTFRRSDQINNDKLEFFFVVNRRTLSADQRNIAVTINKSTTIYNNWKVTEVGTSNTWTVSNTGSFTTNYQPGEGKLFKMEPVMLAGGTLAYNENIPQTTTLNSGITLSIQPGVSLTFTNGASLIVNGTLIANGTSANRIIFNRSGPNGLWGSLKFDGTGATSSILSNVEVYNATSIQILNDANVTVKNSIIQNCNQGVYVYNASPQIINNQITNPSLHGIYVDAINKSPLIQDNSITKTSGNANYKHQEGIILYNGTNGYITHNSISGFDHGIYVGGSNAYFTDYTWQNHFPNNKFTFNRMGVQIGWGAFLIGGYGTNICWNNNISNNDYYNIFVYASSRALVQNNYWGVGNLKQYLDPTSTWEILPALSTDPWLPQGGSQAIAVANTSSSEVQTLATTDKSTPVLNTTSMAKGHVSNDLGTDKNEDEILKEIRLEKEGKIDEAIEYLKKMVKNKKNSLYAITALGGLKERYGKENVQLYFEDLLKDPNEENKSRIKKHLAGFYLNKDEDDKATAIFDELRNDKSSKRDNFEGLLDKFNYILHKKKDIISAKNLLAEMKNKFSDDEDAIMHISTAEMLITEGDNFALGKKQNKTEATLEIEIPKEYALFNNYPNPFNPVTTITYQLPKEGLVTLKIYDVLGNEVKTLVNEQKEMGKYTVQFDASSLASGMYVYQLRVNDYTSTKKMILVK